MELHGLGTGSAKLFGDDNFTVLGTGFHNEVKDTIARPNNASAAGRHLIEHRHYL